MSVGSRVIRKDAPAKVEGTAKFLDDYSFPEMHYAVILRSPYAHARVKKIEIDWDTIKSHSANVATAKDIPGKNIVHIIFDDQPLLVDKVARYVGEAVSIVTAPTKDLAQKALASVQVIWNELPANFDPIHATEKEVPLIYGENNIFCTDKVIKGNTEEGFKQADVIIEREYRTPAQEHAYIENQGAIAVPESDGGMTVYGTMQCPYYVHLAVCDVLGLPKNMVRVIQTYTGGAFGGKEDVPSLICSMVAVAALSIKKPVKLVFTREEDIESTSKRHPAVTRCKIGATKDGYLTAVEVEHIMDAGAYATLSPAVLFRGVMHAVGPYNCPHVKINGRAVATNKVPFGAFRGFGSPQTLFAAESQIDALAAALNMNPLEIRRKNIVHEGDTLYLGQKLPNSVGLVDTLEKAIEVSKWSDKWKPLSKRGILPKDTSQYGIGMSTIFYGVGLGAAGKHMSRTGSYLLVNADGSALFAVGNTEMGQGAITVLSQIVADGLGISYDKVRMLPVDTSRVPDSGPTVASRTTTFSGRSLLKACKEINSRLQIVAADVLKTTPNKVAREGSFWKNIDTNKTVEVVEIIKEAFIKRINLAAAGWDVSPETEYDSEKGQGKKAYVVYAWATNVVEVEVDVETGTIDVKRVVAVHDVGKAVNPETLEGQIQGGSVQGLGYGRYEEIIWDELGRIQNPDLGRYIIPSSKDLPDVESYYVEAEYPEGPFGAKGIGEQPLMGLAPALANAVYNALGIQLTEIPLTPERVWEAIQKHREDKK